MKLSIFIAVVSSIVVAGCYGINSYQLTSKENIKTEKVESTENSKETVYAPSPVYVPAPAPPPSPIRSEIKSEPKIVIDIKQNQEKLSRNKTILLARKNTNINHDDSFVDQLKTANMVMTIPESANINDSVRVELIINAEKEIEKLKQDLTEKGKIYDNTITVSKLVHVNLTAPAFKVENVSPERQILSSVDNTTWLWTLKPSSVGIHNIDVTVTAIVFVKDKEVEHHIKTFKRSVAIEITNTQLITAWLSKYWQWILSTIILPLGIWLYKSKKKSEE